MKVILIKDVPRLGARNNVLEVSDTYALNVLIKQGLAKRVDKAIENKLLKEKTEKEEKQKIAHSKHYELVSSLKSLAKSNNDILFTIKRKADQNGHLYGAITESEIVDAIFELAKISINPKQIVLDKHIKSLGVFEFVLKGATATDKDEKFGFSIVG